jgi:hypothetical protein
MMTETVARVVEIEARWADGGVEKGLEGVNRQLGGTEQAAERATRGIKKTTEEVDLGRRVIDDYVRDIQRMAMAWVGVQGVMKLGQWIVDTDVLRSSTTALAEVVDRQLAGSYWNVASAVAAVRAKTLGLIDDAEILRGLYTSIDAFGQIGMTPGQSVDTYSTVAQFAAVQGKLRNTDPSLVLNQILTGLQRGSPAFLDNYGIIIEQENLLNDSMTETEKKAAITAETMRQLADKLAISADAVERNVTGYERLGTAMANLQTAGIIGGGTPYPMVMALLRGSGTGTADLSMEERWRRRMMAGSEGDFRAENAIPAGPKPADTWGILEQLLVRKAQAEEAAARAAEEEAAKRLEIVKASTRALYTQDRINAALADALGAMRDRVREEDKRTFDRDQAAWEEKVERDRERQERHMEVNKRLASEPFAVPYFPNVNIRGGYRDAGDRFIGSWGSDTWERFDKNGVYRRTDYTGFGSAFRSDLMGSDLPAMAGSMLGSQMFNAAFLGPMSMLTSTLMSPIQAGFATATNELLNVFGLGDRAAQEQMRAARLMYEAAQRMQASVNRTSATGAWYEFQGDGDKAALYQMEAAAIPLDAILKQRPQTAGALDPFWSFLKAGDAQGAINWVRNDFANVNSAISEAPEEFQAFIQALMSVETALGTNTAALLAMTRQLADDLFIASLRSAASGEFAGARSDEARFQIRQRLEMELEEYFAAVRGGSPYAGRPASGGGGGQAGLPIPPAPTVNLDITVSGPSGEELASEIVKVYQTGDLVIRVGGQTATITKD